MLRAWLFTTKAIVNSAAPEWCFIFNSVLLANLSTFNIQCDTLLWDLLILWQRGEL